MTTLLTTALIDRCHAGSRAKGFWDETPPQGQQLMLVISELAEALEADRKGRRTMAGCVEGTVNTLANCPEYFETRFQANIKDTVEDELADAYIRLLDFAGGFKLDKELITLAKCDPTRWIITGVLGSQLLICTDAVCEIDKRRRGGLGIEGAWCDAVTNIEVVCIQEGIDLATHIDLKLRYNATRPNKHNKLY